MKETYKVTVMCANCKVWQAMEIPKGTERKKWLAVGGCFCENCGCELRDIDGHTRAN